MLRVGPQADCISTRAGLLSRVAKLVRGQGSSGASVLEIRFVELVT